MLSDLGKRIFISVTVLGILRWEDHPGFSQEAPNATTSVLIRRRQDLPDDPAVKNLSLPMQGSQLQSPVREDPTTKPRRLNYWSPCTLEPVNRPREASVVRGAYATARVSSTPHNKRKPKHSNEDPVRTKINKSKKEAGAEPHRGKGNVKTTGWDWSDVVKGCWAPPAAGRGKRWNLPLEPLELPPLTLWFQTSGVNSEPLRLR